MLMPMHLPPLITTVSNASVEVLPSSNFGLPPQQSDLTTIYSKVVRFELWKSPITDRVDNQSLARALCEEHPAISVERRIFGGIPHLRGLRLSVGDILGQIYVSGSIEGVKKIYAPDISEDQIKEAIAYAQDFIEAALSSRPQANG